MTKYAGVSDQERFALEMSGYKTDGFYVELGAFHSKEGSNTYYLEKDFGWGRDVISDVGVSGPWKGGYEVASPPESMSAR